MSDQQIPEPGQAPEGPVAPTPGGPSDSQVAPLHPSDPPRIGDFWLDGRLAVTASGIAYLAHGDGRQVVLVTLTEGASADPVARQRLAGQVNQLHIDTVVARGGEGQDGGRLGHRFRGEEDDPVDPEHAPLAPWVALAYDGSPAAAAEARRLLHAVDLSRTSYLGRPSGPDYQLHWQDDQRAGTWRTWPLPWPGRTDRAGWVTILVSWLLMLLLAALALLIAVLLFQNKPPAPPPPPLPTSASGSGSGSPQSSPPSSGSSSPRSSSASAKPSSASASPSSASPSGTPSSSGSPTKPSQNPSMRSPQPSGSSPGAAGSPTPNKRL